ncbi:ABC transporter ATP-binding protein [Phytoactinopolyspora halotolerans]|uniref:ABC transporter ATP-binding protein n=1 Tax=Phytoactinopolyspora halotolerans TaxID=1981512 RepID=A0A6L9SA24_9ACTN|nr:ABC transporter ATP-binding protein [Phytoactinopolyspora halotolerans]NEE01937.1 ABC transporter ATP-binding protein [Phytoactinopolyspora halotolerans]
MSHPPATGVSHPPATGVSNPSATGASNPPATGTPLLSFDGLRVALGPSQPLFAVCVLLNLVSAVAGAAAAALGAWAVSRAILGAPADDLWLPAVLVAGCVVVRTIAVWLEAWLSHAVSFQMMARVRGWIFASLARIAPAGLARRRAGDVATTTLTDSEALEIFYAHTSIYIASSVVTTPVLLAGLAVIDPAVAVAVAPVLVLACVAPLLLRRAAIRHGQAIRETLAELGAEVTENVGAVREIVGYGLTARREERIRHLDEKLGRLQVANTRRAGLETGVAGVVATLGVVVAGAVGGWKVGDGSLAPELLAPAMTLAGYAPSALLQLIGVSRHSGTTRQAAERIAALLYAPTPVDRSGTGTVPDGDTVGLAAERVSFTWPRAANAMRDDAQDAAQADTHAGPGPDAPTLQEIDLRIDAGENVAIAGRSGAGKSTFAALLARLADPDDGAVLAADVDLRELSAESMAAAVGLVPQDVFLFHDTIRSNLLLALTDETPPEDETLWRALETAQIDSLVRSLPAGLDTVVGERGATLSGGERQRLALARAILSGTRALVLDETVSQLDVANERGVRDALAADTSERTTVVIAHRLSTLLGAERIVVLDRGRVVGDGTHDQLLDSCATYRDLVEPQLAALRSSPRM